MGAYYLVDPKFEINSLNYIAVGFGFTACNKLF